jgi:transcriptional regulator with XRE-family HTH domain
MNHRGTDATILARVLDWIAIRRNLADCRRSAGVEESQLADLIGVDKSTIYRIENVADRPDHRPELETIESWLRFTTGVSLSGFFLQLEKGLPSSATERKTVASVSQGHGESHGGGGAVSATEASLKEMQAFLLRVADLAVDAAAKMAGAREAARQAHGDGTDLGGDDPGDSGSVSQK